jgi:toxin FitB
VFLVDTNVWSELRNRRRADHSVTVWANATENTTIFLSVITVFEIERGILLKERRDPAQGAQLRLWLEHRVLEPFKLRILQIDTTIARRCASLHVPDPRPERDALIAATALVHGLTVVTRNTADFAPMGVPVLNPWLTPISSIPK